MNLRGRLLGTILVVASAPILAQDARTVIADATKAMGLDGVTSIYYTGTGANYFLGQNENVNIPWPQTPLNEYARAIDFSQPAARATWVTYGPVRGSHPRLSNVEEIITPASGGWDQQLQIWTTPWGFLKGAQTYGATVQRRTVDGQRYQVLTWNAPLKSPGGLPYRVVGYINKDNLVERVDTWLEHSIYGDMLVSCEYKRYRDNNGLKYPTDFVQKQGDWPVLSLQLLAAFANPPKLQELMKPTAPAAAGPPPGAPPALPGPASDKLADGVYRIRGYYNSLAVEFADYVLLFEPGPENEKRTLAGFAEVHRLFPGKPIRYGVISHHHFDHTGGIEAVVAEGITIVTPELDKPFLEHVLSGPRTLDPDALARSGRKPVIEGFKGDKRVFQDATRTVEIHVIKGLPHADGLVIAWLPKERILAYADMFNFPTADEPVPNPPVVGTQVLLANITRLGLNPEQILSIHTLRPDRLATMHDIRASLGLTD